MKITIKDFNETRKDLKDEVVYYTLKEIKEEFNIPKSYNFEKCKKHLCEIGGNAYTIIIDRVMTELGIGNN